MVSACRSSARNLGAVHGWRFGRREHHQGDQDQADDGGESFGGIGGVAKLAVWLGVSWWVISCQNRVGWLVVVLQDGVRAA